MRPRLLALLPAPDEFVCTDLLASPDGLLSFCSPAIKLSYIFSAHYVAQDFNAQACDFSGNGSISTTAPTAAEAVSAAASSCLALVPSGGVFTPSVIGVSPTAAATNSGGASASASPSASASAGAGSGGDSAASPALARNSLVAVGAALVGVLAGAATLL